MTSSPTFRSFSSEILLIYDPPLFCYLDGNTIFHFKTPPSQGLSCATLSFGCSKSIIKFKLLRIKVPWHCFLGLKFNNILSLFWDYISFFMHGKKSSKNVYLTSCNFFITEDGGNFDRCYFHSLFQSHIDPTFFMSFFLTFTSILLQDSWWQSTIPYVL